MKSVKIELNLSIPYIFLKVIKGKVLGELSPFGSNFKFVEVQLNMTSLTVTVLLYGTFG